MVAKYLRRIARTEAIIGKWHCITDMHESKMIDWRAEKGKLFSGELTRGYYMYVNFTRTDIIIEAISQIVFSY